jgi:hypothetical protein
LQDFEQGASIGRIEALVDFAGEQEFGVFEVLSPEIIVTLASPVTFNAVIA